MSGYRGHIPTVLPTATLVRSLAILAVLTPAVGCSRPFAEGSSRDLTVVTDLAADAPEMLLLKAVVERDAIRIDDEKAYRVRFALSSEPAAFRSTNILLVGCGPESALRGPARRLSPALQGRDVPFAFRNDVWLKGQACGIIWVPTRRELTGLIAKNQNRIFLELDRATFAAVRSRVRSLPRDHRAEARLRAELGISLRVPRGYTLRIDPAARAALLVDEGPPARLLRVRAAAGGNVEPDLVASRTSLARVFRPHEQTLSLVEPTLVPREMAGAERQLHGRWEDALVSAAGPFRYYQVIRGSRRYEVDLAVFAPGKPKLPQLRELQTIAESLGPG